MIVFVSDEGVDEEEYQGVNKNFRYNAYEQYVNETFGSPGYHRVKIGLKRLNHMLNVIQNSWRSASRDQTLLELEHILCRQHELEKQAEKVQDSLLRQYIYDQLDNLAAVRRYISEEVRWDMESDGNPDRAM